MRFLVCEFSLLQFLLEELGLCSFRVFSCLLKGLLWLVCALCRLAILLFSGVI